MDERWKPVVGYEGRYEVSDHGRMRSLAHCARCKPNDGIMRPFKNHKGYAVVWTFRAESPRRMMKVHRAVMAAFVGPCPDGMEVNHKDADKMNPALANLEYVTPAQNVAHAKANHLYQEGAANHGALLNDEQVREIRESSIPTGQLARQLGFAYSLIWRVRTGRGYPQRSTS